MPASSSTAPATPFVAWRGLSARGAQARWADRRRIPSSRTCRSPRLRGFLATASWTARLSCRSIQHYATSLRVKCNSDRAADPRTQRRQPAEGGRGEMAADGTLSCSCSRSRRAAWTSTRASNSTSSSTPWPRLARPSSWSRPTCRKMLGMADRVLVMWEGRIVRAWGRGRGQRGTGDDPRSRRT